MRTVPETWHRTTVGNLCTFESGTGFGPSDWTTSGLPIIRIQNLNGSQEFNYYSGNPDPSWIVEPGELLFAWAGVKGVSFGPTIWRGARGVLNQHIYRIRPMDGVELDWLYLQFLHVTASIEANAHGFKSNLVHVRKADITGQVCFKPPVNEQRAIANVMATWDRGIRQLTEMIAAKVRFKQGLMQQLLTGNRRFKEFGKAANAPGQLPDGWQRLKASELFGNFTQKNNDGEDLLSVTQDRGVIPRTMLEGKVVMPESGTDGYKLVEPGDFVISLRSFQGGLEYSEYRGLVSPAYTVLKPRQTINDAFFRHYFKSYDFIQRLAVAVIGIRDGKQISYGDFESVKLPMPPLEEQKKIAAVLDVSGKEIELFRKQLDALKQQKKGLMQKLLTGEVRVKL